jgi:hypothetical protein
MQRAVRPVVALTLTHGTNGTQAVADNVPNWRNVAPCGN